MTTIQVTDELMVMARPDDRPYLVIANAGEGAVIVYLNEVTDLVDALIEASLELAEVESERATRHIT